MFSFNKSINLFLEFLDGEQFDNFLGKITKELFRIILFLGVPYFLFIVFRLLN
ncbi:hypothetical protein [Fredinandcohnia quinoae]|uniref:Uncharacterized protein n=1 Tax=Fredinandcohnia quinoae TaxID=2918902 RepID=A0AAW5EB04_9BACI|nr:hypothetical protein [Fredinandcohnia sp. SECRCQ15]MCH1626343.1 hypothetical protein [Fredinandcohnia sp. SECRCQ15]